MKSFYFGLDVVSKVIDELEKSKKFIKIAVFQIHNAEIFEVLKKKAKSGVKVDIITLPYDSINDDVREAVTARFEEIKKHGAKIHFCKWNVGDPERTTTAVGRWYSFHGKFIITENAAIILSANLTDSSEIEAAIFYWEKEKILEFESKFNELKELFINEADGYYGTIRSRILSACQGNEPVFTLPRSIGTTHSRTWILHYPVSLCQKEFSIENKLYIAPFDCMGRLFLEKIVNEAREFVYISTESFTDKEFPHVLKKASLNGLKVKILTGASSMDFSDRLQAMLKDLIASGIELRTTNEDLHAKLWITDNVLAVTSINLNNMNLGFYKTSRFWRENTETIGVCTDKALIKDAKSKFETLFSNSDATRDVRNVLTEKSLKVAESIIKKIFSMRSTSEAKQYLAKLIVDNEIQDREKIIRLVKKAKQISGNDRLQKSHLEEARRSIS